MSGVLVQWLIDPGDAPTELDIAVGLLRLAGHLTGQAGDRADLRRASGAKAP
jgi:hypothetical protein